MTREQEEELSTFEEAFNRGYELGVSQGKIKEAHLRHILKTKELYFASLEHGSDRNKVALAFEEIKSERNELQEKLDFLTVEIRKLAWEASDGPSGSTEESIELIRKRLVKSNSRKKKVTKSDGYIDPNES